jgi:MFS family permease
MIIASERTRNRMVATGVAAMVIMFVWLNYSQPEAPQENRIWCGVILSLALWPLVRWAKRGGEGFPSFEALCASIIPTEALPLLSKHNEILTYGEDTVRMAALAIVIFQLSLLAGNSLVRAEPMRNRFFTTVITSKNIPGILSTMMSVSSLYIFVTTFIYNPPAGLVGPLRAVFTGLGVISAYTLSSYLSRQLLNRQLHVLLIFNIAIAGLAYASSLILAPFISLLLISLLGYLSTATRIPWLALVFVVGLVAFLHNGKSDMRERYWLELGRERLTLAQLPQFYSDWVEMSLNPKKSTERADQPQGATRKLLERVSLFHMLSMVVEYTPSRQPYLAGETYTGIPAQFVPRLFWPEKPFVHVSTHRLSVYYGLQDERGTETTTISFGYRAEAWANFGLAGMVLIGLLFGSMTKFAWAKTKDAPTFSPIGIMMVAFTAWCVDGGQTLSVWLSSLYQTMIMLIILSVSVQKFLRD